MICVERTQSQGWCLGSKKMTPFNHFVHKHLNGFQEGTFSKIDMKQPTTYQRLPRVLSRARVGQPEGTQKEKRENDEGWTTDTCRFPPTSTDSRWVVDFVFYVFQYSALKPSTESESPTWISYPLNFLYYYSTQIHPQTKTLLTIFHNIPKF